MTENIWNLLHDGSITRIKGEIPGNIVLEVEIEYLTKMFFDNFKVLVIKLEGCSFFQYYKNYDSPLINDIPKIVDAKPWITSGEIQADGSLVIYCNEGLLKTQYENLFVFLEDETPVSFQQLDEKCKLYWDRFGK